MGIEIGPLHIAEPVILAPMSGVTDLPFRRLILKRAEAQELHRAAVKEGMRTMYDDGMAKALAGLTTVEEVLRVTRDV